MLRELSWQIPQILECFIHQVEDFKEKSEEKSLQDFLNSPGEAAGSKPEPALNTAPGLRFDVEANVAPGPLHLLLTRRGLLLYVR